MLRISQMMQSRIRRYSMDLYSRTYTWSCPALHAILWYLLAEKHGDKNCPKLLCIYKDIGKEDFRALGKYGAGFCYVVVPMSVIQRLFTHNFGTSTNQRFYIWRYYHAKGFEREKLAYRETLVQIFKYLRKLYKFRGVATSVFNLRSVQEVGPACRSVGLHYFILHKEGYVLPRRIKDMVTYMKFGSSGGFDADPKTGLGREKTYIGCTYASALFTYTKFAAEVAVNIDIPGLANCSIYPYGAPRSDSVMRKNTDHARGGKEIVFFTASPQSDFYFFPEMFSPKHRELRSKIFERSQILFETIVNYFKEKKENRLIIKYKSSATKNQDYVMGLLERSFGNIEYSGHENIQLTGAWNATELIGRVDFVIALNSTVVLESIYNNVGVLTPDYSEIFNEAAWNIFDGFEDLTKFISDTSSLDKVFNGKSIDANSEVRRTEFFEHVFGIPNKMRSSEAIGDKMREIVDRKLV